MLQFSDRVEKNLGSWWTAKRIVIFLIFFVAFVLVLFLMPGEAKSDLPSRSDLLFERLVQSVEKIAREEESQADTMKQILRELKK